MLYFEDRYRNRITINQTFRISGYETQIHNPKSELIDKDGTIGTGHPVIKSTSRVVEGKIFYNSAAEVEAKRRELDAFINKGLVRFGYQDADWYYQGEVSVFAWLPGEKSGRRCIDVKIVFELEDPYMQGEEVTEKFMITPDLPELDFANPYPMYQVRYGAIWGGVLQTENSSWSVQTTIAGYSGRGYIQTSAHGDGVQFKVFGGPVTIRYYDNIDNIHAIYIDGVLTDSIVTTNMLVWKEIVIQAGESLVTIVSEGNLVLDNAKIATLKQNTIINNSKNAYPIIKIRPITSNSIIRPVGKVPGDASHPFTLTYGSALGINDISLSDGVELSIYENVFFLNGNPVSASTLVKGKFSYMKLEYRPNDALYTNELQKNVKQLINCSWFYGKGAPVDLDFEVDTDGDGVGDGWTFAGYGATPTLFTESYGGTVQRITVHPTDTGRMQRVERVIYAEPNKTYKLKFKVTGDGRSEFLVKVKDYGATMSPKQVGPIVAPTIGESKSIEFATASDTTSVVVSLYNYTDPDTLSIESWLQYADVSLEEYGADMYIYRSGAWRVVSTSNTLNFPQLATFNSVYTPYDPGDYIQPDGKVYLLINSKYSSDGITPSEIYLDTCHLELALNYAKLGTNAVVNQAGNLIPPFTQNEWNLLTYGKVISDYYLEISRPDAGTAGYIDVPVDPHQTYTFSVEGNCVVYTQARDKDKVLVKNLDTIVTTTTNRTITYDDLPYNCVFIRIYPAIISGNTVTMINPTLTQTEFTQTLFEPRDVYKVELDEAISLVKNEELRINPEEGEIDKNGENLLHKVDTEFLYNPIKLCNGVNHLTISLLDGLGEIEIKYPKKWR